MTTKSATRIYAVAPKIIATGEPPALRLVRAANQSQALRHVAGSMFGVSVASQDDCITAAGNGVKVEIASADSE